MLGMCAYGLYTVRFTPYIYDIGRWLPPVGIALRFDTISMTFVSLTALMYTLFIIYNSTRHYTNRMFYMLFLILQGMLIGIFLLDDLFSIFYICRGFYHGRCSAHNAQARLTLYV